jgi:6-pyruvoyltetrahydropterin/6-carboxytetrahydropterin synthase
MTRRIDFSAGHRYWQLGLDREANRRLFGPFASPFNHGHNYVLRVTVSGPVDEKSGMVLNIKRLDDLLKVKVLALFDGRSLNDEVPAFADTPPTLENLLLFLWELISGEPAILRTRVCRSFRWDADLLRSPAETALALPETVRLDALRLEETPSLYGEIERGPNENIMTLTRSYEFAASHRLHSEEMDADQNRALFGKCNNPAGHGHNYVLEVTVEGEPGSRTGMIVNIDELDRCVSREVVDRYDHKNLNVDVPELAGAVPTSENVARAIFAKLEGRLPTRLSRVRLHETARSSFEVTAR